MFRSSVASTWPHCQTKESSKPSLGCGVLSLGVLPSSGASAIAQLLTTMPHIPGGSCCHETPPTKSNFNSVPLRWPIQNRTCHFIVILLLCFFFHLPCQAPDPAYEAAKLWLLCRLWPPISTECSEMATVSRHQSPWFWEECNNFFLFIYGRSFRTSLRDSHVGRWALGSAKGREMRKNLPQQETNKPWSYSLMTAPCVCVCVFVFQLFVHVCVCLCDCCACARTWAQERMHASVKGTICVETIAKLIPQTLFCVM